MPGLFFLPQGFSCITHLCQLKLLNSFGIWNSIALRLRSYLLLVAVRIQLSDSHLPSGFGNIQPRCGCDMAHGLELFEFNPFGIWDQVYTKPAAPSASLWRPMEGL